MNGTDRTSELAYLEDTLKIVDAHLEKYREEIAVNQESIDEMLVHYHDNDVELWTLLNNTITLNEHMKRSYGLCLKAKKKPYFGRIIFRDEELGKELSLYIGRGNISVDHVHLQVVDWRAPVANAYYENGLGKCSYTAPEGKEIPIELFLKRTYEIEDGVLKDYFDTEVVANDELLTKYLSRNKEAVLGEIVATIQKEQNAIIRKTPFHNTLVQGVAGSGKTTVAMHRISYILYNYADRFRPQDFYIVGSNQILLNYITGVLPDLDVVGACQMTMEQLFLRLLYEESPRAAGKVRPFRNSADSVKGTTRWFKDLCRFIRRLENDSINQEDVLLYPSQFVEGLENGVGGVYDRREEEREKGRALETVVLVQGDAVMRYVTQNPRISIQSKINMLNERLNIRVQDEFLTRGYRYSEAERKAIAKAFRNYYGPKEWKRSIYDLYEEFVEEQRRDGVAVSSVRDTYDVYDLASLALLYKLVKETEEISEAHHVVIDEAQDFGMMVYRTLHACIKDCTYTVMGDVSQNIHFGYGLSDWEELRKLLISTNMDSFCTLRKSYRNTIEISEFATAILRHGSFPVYPVEPIIRHGRPVQVEQTKQLLERTVQICLEWQERELQTIAIICRDFESARDFGEALAKRIPVLETDPEKLTFGNGIMVLPVEYTKGLEFDACILLDPSEKDYPSDDGHAKLLYVAATRALHELCVLYVDDVTGLIADPLPADRVQMNFAEEMEEESTRKVAERTSLPKASGGLPAKPKAVVRTPVKKTPERPSFFQPKIIAPDGYKDPVKQSAPAPIGQFGDMPDTSVLKELGHARKNFAIRWITKERDCVTLQSQAGVIAIRPITDQILRVSFADSALELPATHALVARGKAGTGFSCRESSKSFEMATKGIRVSVEKATGLITFADATGKLLFAEKGPEPHVKDKKHQRWYLSFAKNEKLTGLRPGTDHPILSLKGGARYLSDNQNRDGFPLILSDRRYGIVPATTEDVIFCDIPVYGSYLSVSDSRFDVYILTGEDLCGAYAHLMGL